MTDPGPWRDPGADGRDPTPDAGDGLPAPPPVELPHDGPRPYAPTWPVPSAIALVAAFVLLNALAGWAAVFVRGTGLPNAVQSAAAFGVIVLAQALVVGVAWLSARRGGVAFSVAARFVPPRLPAWVGVSIGWAIGARLFATAWAAAVQALGWRLQGQDIDPTRLLPEGVFGLALTAVLVVVAAPLAEETIFRGVLVPSLSTRYSTRIAVWVSAVLFALVHFNAFSTVPVLVAGWVFGRLLVRSGSVWPSVLAHAVFNATGFLALVFYRALGLG